MYSNIHLLKKRKKGDEISRTKKEITYSEREKNVTGSSELWSVERNVSTSN